MIQVLKKLKKPQEYCFFFSQYQSLKIFKKKHSGLNTNYDLKWRMDEMYPTICLNMTPLSTKSLEREKVCWTWPGWFVLSSTRRTDTCLNIHQGIKGASSSSWSPLLFCKLISNFKQDIQSTFHFILLDYLQAFLPK